MSQKVKMRKCFQTFEGGLFSSVEKADVGNSYQELGKRGVDLMGWADPFTPDFTLPQPILKKAIDAIQSPLSTHYTAPIGSEALKIEIAKKLEQKNNCVVDPLRNILITPGSDSGLYYAMLSCLDEGDEVLIPSPSYPNNFQNAQLMNVKAIPILLKAENDFQLMITDFKSALTPRTKMVVLTHPNNPTTTVFNRRSLVELADFIIENDLILVCDQAFEDFTYENEMITPASLPGMWERTITVYSVSKGMGFSGFRVGYLVTNDVFMDALYGGVVSVLGATNTLAQSLVIEAFKDQSFMQTFNDAFDYRRHKAYEIINSIPNVSMKLPESGFLCWLDISQLNNHEKVVDYLVKNASVCVNDGVNYGDGGAGHLRIVLGVYADNQRVIDALNRIKEALICFQKEENIC